MTIPVCDAAQPVGRVPAERLPAGTVDCHFHVFGPAAAYAYAPGRSYTPPDAPLAAYEHLCDTVGIARSVIIQPSPYGFDNTCTLDAMAASRLPMRAILVLDDTVSDAELERAHAAGARGVRINLLFKAGAALSDATRLSDRIRAFGWHVQVLADVSALEDLRGIVGRLRVPVVFDHFGHVPALKGASDPGFQALVDLVTEGRAWVKLSGAYRGTAAPRTPYDDMRPFLDRLVAAHPAQLVWGTDWPHPAIAVPMPNDIDLVEIFGDWVQDPALREAILVANPERLYGFPAWPDRRSEKGLPPSG